MLEVCKTNDALTNAARQRHKTATIPISKFGHWSCQLIDDISLHCFPPCGNHILPLILWMDGDPHRSLCEQLEMVFDLHPSAMPKCRFQSLDQQRGREEIGHQPTNPMLFYP